MCPFDAPPPIPDDDEPGQGGREPFALRMAAMIWDCQAAGAALLRRDLTEALARVHAVQGAARTAGLDDIEDAAGGLRYAIVAASEGRPNGLGLAFEALSRTLDRRLDLG